MRVLLRFALDLLQIGLPYRLKRSDGVVPDGKLGVVPDGKLGVVLGGKPDVVLDDKPDVVLGDKPDVVLDEELGGELV